VNGAGPLTARARSKDHAKPLDPAATILLVEDDPNDVFLMKRALKAAAVANPLQVAGDGREAVAYLSGTGPFADRKRFPLPGLLFLDLKLPYKSGFEVLQWIRTRPELEGIPVAVLTSSEEERDIKEAARLGARSFLVKPPTKGMLGELVGSF